MPIAISRVGFSLMEPRIFVDLDGTLKTQYDGNKGDLLVEVSGKKWRFSKRPHADEFLTKLNKLGKVYLLTAAGRSYAQKVLAALKLESYFETIFSAENYAAGIPLYMNWVIIDDTEEIAILKARAMGSNIMASDEDLKKRIVFVKSYSGRDDDKELLRAFDDVKKVVESE